MDSYEKAYFDFCVEAMTKGYVIKSSGREMLKYGNRQVPFSRALWNWCHPEDPVLATEVIHHKDGDKMNNIIENLEKMSAGEHMKMHTLNPSIVKRTEKRPKKPTSREESIALRQEIRQLKEENKDLWQFISRKSLSNAFLDERLRKKASSKV